MTVKVLTAAVSSVLGTGPTGHRPRLREGLGHVVVCPRLGRYLVDILFSTSAGPRSIPPAVPVDEQRPKSQTFCKAPNSTVARKI